ncbi:MAG: deoxyguanosinetriphosphate triphosphohydrolase, partial [Ruminiclostridium sp.]|nr:deoxyguanosinetriphosphate triphosphohydrolase [Ruminiclostridium sp.]
KGKARIIIDYLYNYYLKSPEQLPPLFKNIAKEYGTELAICDFISGMTDDFAVDYFKELCIPKSWSY